jgi:hypothetical protein
LDQVCVSADDPIILRLPAGTGPRRISDHGERKRSLSDRLRRAAGDALNYFVRPPLL